MEKQFEILKFQKEYEANLMDFLEECLPESGRALDINGRHSFYKDIANCFKAFWCMFDQGKVIGVVAVKELDAVSCELKSLYLLERYHGRGYGKRLLEKAVTYAREAGYERMYLDSLSTSIKAIALYRKAGFVDTDRYNQNERSDVFMVLDLNKNVGNYMQVIEATQERLELVKEITHKTISEIYPHYYPTGVVEFFLAHHCEENIKKDIDSGIVHLIMDGEKGIGTVTVRGNEICRLFVLPEWQHRGIGRMLMDFAEEVIGEKYAEILIDSSLPAKQIYLKRGYVATETHTIKAENSDILVYDVMKKYIWHEGEKQ